MQKHWTVLIKVGAMVQTSQLHKIQNENRTEKEKIFIGNQLANYIKVKLLGVIIKEAYIDTKIYIIEGFPGKGNWAGIPHIDIVDREITNTSTKGYYILN